MSTESARAFLGQSIRRARENANLSMDELAALIGQNKSLISKWENGVHMPSIWWLCKIAVATHSEPHDMIGSSKTWAKLTKET